MLLPCEEIETAHKGISQSIIWLHGLGATNADFMPIVSELALPQDFAARFIFPQAPILPVTLNNRMPMPAWYDIFDVDRDAKVDTIGIARSGDAIEALINREVERGIPIENITLAGFSQGAVIALTTFLRCSFPLKGIIALSGYLPAAITFIEAATALNKNVPIFMARGKADTVVDYAYGKSAYFNLKSAGFNVSWHAYDMAHTVNYAEISDIRRCLLA